MSLGRMLEKQGDGYGATPKRLTFSVGLSERESLDFRFDFPDTSKGLQAINAIIGPNGVGKSRALMAFAKSAAKELGAWPSKTIIYSHDVEVFKSSASSDVVVISMAPTRRGWRRVVDYFSRLIGEEYYYRDINILGRLLSDVIPVESLYLPIIDTAAVHGVIEGRKVRVKGRTYVPLEACIQMRDPSIALLLRKDIDPLIRVGEDTLVYPSSGEMALFAFLVSILVESEKGSLILVDEPENHLHPQFISLLMRAVSQVLVDADSLAIVVTHSPFVIREVDKNSVTVMKKGRHGDVELFTPTLQTHGGNVSEISSYVFEDEYIKKGYENVIDSMISVGAMTKGEIIELVRENFGSDGVNYALRSKV